MGLLLESTSLELLSIGIIVFTSVIYYFKHTYNFWKRKGVKQLAPIIPFGNAKNLILLRSSVAEQFQDLHNEAPNEPFIGIYELKNPLLLVRDPELIKHVLVKDFASFHDRGLSFDENLDPLSAHLLNLSGTKWRNLRSKLTPTFTSGKMKMMFHLMTECADELKEYLQEPARNGEMLEMKEVMAKFTTDVIGSCAFGLQFNSINNTESEFRKMGRRVFQPSLSSSIRRIVRAVLPSLLRLLHIKMLPEDINNFFIGAVKETIDYREKNNIVRNDFMQLLIQLKNKGKIHEDEHTKPDQILHGTNENSALDTSKNTEMEFTDNLLASQAFIFFLAGFETSSTTLSFCLHELAVNPDVQRKLMDEVDATLENCDGKITYDALQNMPYLDKVVNETLRKHSPAPIIGRVVTKPFVIPGTSVKLDVGQRIVISIYGLHYDQKYFPEPEKFNPENFSEEAKAKRPHYTYLPFGEGPRNCIGLRFGLLQTKLGLITLLSNFEFSVCEKTEQPIKLDPRQLISSSKTGAWLKINKRSDK